MLLDPFDRFFHPCIGQVLVAPSRFVSAPEETDAADTVVDGADVVTNGKIAGEVPLEDVVPENQVVGSTNESTGDNDGGHASIASDSKMNEENRLLNEEIGRNNTAAAFSQGAGSVDSPFVPMTQALDFDYFSQVSLFYLFANRVKV